MSTLKVNNITDSTGLVAPIFPPGSAQLNPMAGREDKVINGDFLLWQRGLSSTLAGYVAADRWVNNFATGTVTQSLQAFAPGEKLGVTNPYHFLRQTVSGQSAVGSLATTTQRIESARSYSGETITVLFWARRSSGSGNISVDFDQVFGGAGNNVLGIGTTSIPLTNAWTPYAAVISVPSITGKVITPGTDYLGLNFWISAGSNFNARTNNLGLQNIGVDLWGVHIRQGAWTAAATADYRPRDLSTETMLCQRYYEFVGAYAMGWSGAVGTLIGNTVRFAVSKRAVPTWALITQSESVGFNAINIAPLTTEGFRFWGSTGVLNSTAYYSAFYGFSAEIN